jgi:hypothetical protein
VLVAAAPASAPAARATPSVEPAPPAAARARSPWLLVGAALAALALAHLGLWLLLTAAARSGVRGAEERYDPEHMERALAEEEPAPGAGLSDLRRAERRETARAWDTHRRHVSTVGYALLGAFLLQAGVVVVVKLKSSSRGRRPRATRGAG